LQVIFKGSSEYNDITVYETAELDGKLGHYRVLQFSESAVQGAMDLKQPQRVVLEYPRAMMHLMEAGNPDFESVFVIGHGTGTIAGQYPKKRFVIAEIDSLVVEVSRSFFGYSLSNVTVGDGREVLEQQAAGSLDYVLVDAFTEAGTPAHLASVECFQLTHDKLAPQGSLIMNLMGRPHNDRRISAIHTALQEVYAYTKVLYLPGGDPYDLHNILLIGSSRPIRYQARQLAGFVELEVVAGHVMRD
jgi:spermidine synthase